MKDAKWYQLNVRNKYVKYDSSSKTYYDTYDTPDENDNTRWFAFVGNNIDGYKIFNYAAGANVAMGADNVNTNTRLKAVPYDEAQSFVFEGVTYNNAPALQIREKNGANAFLNQQDTNLGYWNSDQRGNEGNVFVFTKVADASYNYVAFDCAATNNGEDEITWKTAAFTAENTAAESMVSGGEFITNITITDDDKTLGEGKYEFNVTADHSYPFAAGKFYLLKNRYDNNHVAVDNNEKTYARSTRNMDKANYLWSFERVENTPDQFYVKNLALDKYLSGTSGVVSYNAAKTNAYTIWKDTQTNSATGFCLHLASSTSANDVCVGSHAGGSNLDANFPNSVHTDGNASLSVWTRGDSGARKDNGSIFWVEEFDENILNVVNGKEGYVGSYTNFSDFTTAKESYTNDKSGANLKTALDALASLETIELTEGKYYRFHAPGHSTRDSKDFCLTASEEGQAMKYSEDTGASSIFYWTGSSLKAYKNGLYINGVNASTEEGTISIDRATNNAVIGTNPYRIHNGTSYLVDWANNGNIQACNDGNNNWVGWEIEEVEDMYLVTTEAEQTVETEDGVQIQNGGYLYVAESATITASEKAGYTADIVKDDEAKTITVTYTEAVELTSGYYYIKNAASNKYLANNYNSPTTTTLSGSKVTTNNGVWKVDVNDNGTITLKNGIATPLYVGGTPITKLTFEDAPVTSGVYFTEKIDGSGDALAIGSEEAPATTWVFEPIADDSKIVDVIINGDNGEGVVSYNGQKATNSGFFVLAAGASVAGFSSNDIDGKEKSEIKHLTVMPYYIDVEYYVYNDAAVEELQTLIDEIVPNVQNNEIGYPKFSNGEVNEAYAEICWYYNNTLLTSGNSEENQTRYTAALQSARTIANCSDINLPTAGGFYTLTNADGTVTKTYYIKEGNDGLSQLICYENGQFAKISNDFTSVDFSAIGTASGEDFAFMAARTNEKGMPVNLGKVCVWQSGEGPLPSGDGNIYSGWTIRKLNDLTVNLPASSYTTFYAPVAMQVSENLKVYTASVNEGNASITFIELPDGKIPARTGVLIAGNKEDLTAKSITVLSESVDEQESDLKGAEYTQSYALGVNTGYNSTLNGKPIGWHAYTLQSGTWKRYTGTKLSGFKAHLELEDIEANATKAYTFSFGENIVTSIDELFGNAQTKQVFDLSGRQVNKTQRGLYIVNGNKVLR